MTGVDIETECLQGRESTFKRESTFESGFDRSLSKKAQDGLTVKPNGGCRAGRAMFFCQMNCVGVQEN